MESLQSPRMRATEASKYLACSIDHLYDLHRAGKLRKYSEGRRFTYWKRAEVEVFARGGDPYAQPESGDQAAGA